MSGNEISAQKPYVFDGKVDNFSQGYRGDCVLLAELHSLSEKTWGSQAIFNAIRPDSNGGVTVRFQSTTKSFSYRDFGSEQLPTQNVKVTSTDLKKVDKEIQWTQLRATPGYLEGKYADKTYVEVCEDLGFTPHCSTGDPDVTAIELAYEKYAKQHGLLTQGCEDYLSNIKTSISKLLVGEETYGYSYNPMSPEEYEEEVKIHEILGFDKPETNLYKKQVFFDEYQKNQDDYVCIVGFEEDKDGVITNHAYSLRRIESFIPGMKKAILVNPHDTSKEIEVPYYKFLENVDYIRMYKNPSKEFTLSNVLFSNAKIAIDEDSEVETCIKVENIVESFEVKAGQSKEALKEVCNEVAKPYKKMYEIVKPGLEKVGNFFADVFSPENVEKYKQATQEAQQ